MPQNNSSSSRTYALKSKQDFARFFHPDAKVARLGVCTVFSVQNDLEHYRLGITLKIKGGRAVDRNKLRRIVRGIFQRHKNQLGSRDYNLVVSRQSTLGHPYPRRLKEALAEFFDQL